jgi:hypothetical protein
MTTLLLSEPAQHSLIRDEDGTFSGGWPGKGSILSRAEFFSANSFFGIAYKDPVNIPTGKSFWYPNLPAKMRSDSQGQLLNVTARWLSNGFGIERSDCSLQPDWNAWLCFNLSSYRMMVLESMDADHETRRIRSSCGSIMQSRNDEWLLPCMSLI